MVANAIKLLVDYLARRFDLEPKSEGKKKYMLQIHATAHSLRGQAVGAFAHLMLEAEDGATVYVIHGIDVAGELFTWRIIIFKHKRFYHLSSTCG